ncbi:MAG TPA: PA domain-containing protein, partial [Ignavibacteria bacterium]|nr:PA domain-containing protein [Ignavibacteria bacterium]
MGKKLPVLLLLLIFTSFQAVYSQSVEADVTELKANLEYLSSDELMGRGTLTEGERLASEFIAEKFRQYGVKPFGDNGTYFQNFPLVLTSFTEDSKIKIFSDGKETVYNVKDDFIIDARRVSDEKFQRTKNEIVFAGFGITAPEFGYDDYKGLDVKGKTVLILDDEPLSDDTLFFRGARPTRYSFWGTKARIARDNGAAGVVIIAPESTVKEWQRLSEWTSTPGLRYPES